MSIRNLEDELSFSQLELLRKGNLTFESLMFQSCTELKRYLRSRVLSREDKSALSKLRKRGREKWLHVRDCEDLQAEIWQLEEIAFVLMEEKFQLEQEIERLKIKCVLAAREYALYQNDVANETMDTA